MGRRYLSFIIYSLFISLALIGCTDSDVVEKNNVTADALELTGIEAVIEGTTGVTRAGTVTPLADYVGRSKFNGGDKIVFTKISRTANPINTFTYVGNDSYDGIIFEAGSEGGWSRNNGPERIYWTDAVSNHTFIAYGAPQDNSYDWKKYQFTEGETKKTYYIGSLGDPTQTGTTQSPVIIDYSLSAEEQTANTTTENNTTVYRNPKLEKEDLLIAYDDKMKAEPGGSVALVKFNHALSSVRVVVNISGFSSSSSAADNQTVVSNMRLLHQPTMYLWEQSNWKAQPFRAQSTYATAEQAIVNSAWSDSETKPAYNQRKDIKLWIPHPEGSGTNQSKTFTFYGITTPQPVEFLSNLDGDNVQYQKTELKFDVTYPDPLKPSTTKTKTYTAVLPYSTNEADKDKNVYFEAGYNTTINIALNHRNEYMTVGAEYENWQFVATPDVGELKKNSTFLQGTSRYDIDGTTPIVTIVGDDKATIDDATWLYELNGIVYDIYGHDGSTAAKAYQISTAYQLLSFAYEVTQGNNGVGRDFKDKFIRLDADITLQPTSDKTRQELDQYIYEDGENKENSEWTDAEDALSWIGIGDDTHTFNGTFLGGKRFIYRLYGKPLFYSLGEHAKIEQLQVNTIHKPDGSPQPLEGSGMYANINAGLICGCKVVGDVAFNASTAGAFVGTNTGDIWASYHIGATSSTAATPSVGGLVGSNSGVIASCYNAGKVTGTTTGGITASSSGTLYNNYYNSTLLTAPTFTHADVTGKLTGDMTKLQFVTDLNTGITTWRTNRPDKIYDTNYPHKYEYQPANYPKLN